MSIEILKSKIHRAFVTEVNINYQGSITIDEDLMDAANIIENEKVQVLNYNNGVRIDTYVIKGKRGSGEICINGPAARNFIIEDPIIVLSFATIDCEEAKKITPKIIYVDQSNKIISK